jgi:hypothetical protein
MTRAHIVHALRDMHAYWCLVRVQRGNQHAAALDICGASEDVVLMGFWRLLKMWC